MKKYDLTKPNRKKKHDRMKRKEGEGNHYFKVLRKGVDGKPDYIWVVSKAKVLKLLNPEIKRTREYKLLSAVA